MRHHILKREQFIARPVEDVFKFFADAANLEAITPPWLRFRIHTPLPVAMTAGTHIAYRIRWRAVPIHWETEIVDWNPPHRFTDVQLRGPYALWNHAHSFFSERGGIRMIDEVCYSLPLGALGEIAHRLKVRRDLEAIFDYRASRISARFWKVLCRCLVRSRHRLLSRARITSSCELLAV